MQIVWAEAILQNYIDCSKEHSQDYLVVFICFHFIIRFMASMLASILSIILKSTLVWEAGQISKHWGRMWI